MSSYTTCGRQILQTRSHFVFAFPSSHSFTAGARARAQLGPYYQSIRPHSCHTDTVLRSRIHIRQKQLSHIFGQEQGQCCRYCDLIATLQNLMASNMWHQTWCLKACTSVTNHFLHSQMYICLAGSFRLSLIQFPQVCLQVDSPCGRCLSLKLKCESVCLFIM